MRRMKTDCAPLKEAGMLLVDSGGQYLGGTTGCDKNHCAGGDFTGDEGAFHSRGNGMLRLAGARFLYGCTGRNLDIRREARFGIWEWTINAGQGTVWVTC